jgi:hypothetical protein
MVFFILVIIMVRAKKEVNGNEVNNEFDGNEVNNEFDVDHPWDLPSVTVSAKKITFTNKINKEKSLIIDAFRIIGWQEFKSEYKVKGLEGYQEFFEAWSVHEIHQMGLNELQELYSDLGYSLSDLVKIRNDYYSARRNTQSLEESDFSGDEPAF